MRTRQSFKLEITKVAKEYVGKRPRSRNSFTPVKILDSTEKNLAVSLAGKRDQYRLVGLKLY